MGNVLEIKPTGWQNNGEGLVGTGPGNDVRSIFMDKDGVTAWLLQSQNSALTAGSGFARINISTGAILFSGNWNNSFSTVLQRNRNSGTTLWIQIGSNYFVLDNATSILHKMIVSPSSIGSWGNGYLTDVATLNLSTNIPTSSTNVQNFATANIGGINYIAITINGLFGGKNLVVVNADTMTLVGTWTFPSTFLGEAMNAANNTGLFFDKFGKIWVVTFVTPTSTDPNGFVHGMFLSTGDPATPSGLTTNFVSASSLPANFFKSLPDTYTVYNSSNHSIVVGNIITNNAQGNQAMMVVDLVSRSSIASRFSSGSPIEDIDWWDSFNQGGNYSAFLLGIQSDGSLNVPAANGDGGLTTFSPSVSKLNPSTLAKISVTDVTAAINSSSVTDKVDAFHLSVSLCGVAISSSLIMVAYSTDANDINHGGSPVYIIPLGLCGASAPKGNPYIGSTRDV